MFSASRINPSWVALDKSRGIETESSKVFMRTTVVFTDLLVYVPALVLFARTWQGTRSSRTQVSLFVTFECDLKLMRWRKHLALLTMLLQPALLLVDFGHFQYNSVMLGTSRHMSLLTVSNSTVGFTLLALDFFAAGQDLLGAVCFVLSLGFKQMALYYAPAIGAYLLGKCLYLGPSQG